MRTIKGLKRVAAVELTDQDILDAMRQIPGYLDISTTDFRALYVLAHDHATDRLFRKLRAGDLMLTGIRPLRREQRLHEAARALVAQGRKGLPVVDAEGRVCGMLTETDYLNRLGVSSFLELLLELMDDRQAPSLRFHETLVGDAMTAPAITVRPEAGVNDILGAFERHPGRSMPVVDAPGTLCGLLLRKVFVQVARLEAAS